ncbi:ribonuclease H-like domain-containing protein [Tanacetum coccineum]
MTLQDPTWHMDTGASSHLNFNTSNLSTIFNKRLFSFVHVGNGNGHSIIPSSYRPLHLHNDFLTFHILLRCDSSGDLYPVSKPSTSPTAFLSTSASTWHQLLGHLGDEVLRSLTSRQFISCNKAKSTHICHACQLGKHVKLPFHSSDSIVEHCFDIIHSDLWTSPIHKFHANGNLSQYKARLVANGSIQQLGIDVDETFSLVVKPATIRTVLSLAVSHKCPIHQLDVKNAFLNGDLSETFYMYQPSGFIDSWYLSMSVFCINLYMLLERAHMVNCNPFWTHVDTKSKMVPDGVPVQDPTLYRSLAGGLQYLTFTRPDLSYAVQHVCLYMHDPREPHLTALKRILHYVCGTLDFGLHLYSSSTTSLVGYTDVDWAGCPYARRSTSGYCVFLGDNLLSWSIFAISFVSFILLSSATLVYSDNVSAIYMSANPVQHQRTNHIEIDIHFVPDMVTAG